MWTLPGQTCCWLLLLTVAGLEAGCRTWQAPQATLPNSSLPNSPNGITVPPPSVVPPAVIRQQRIASASTGPAASKPVRRVSSPSQQQQQQQGIETRSASFSGWIARRGKRSVVPVSAIAAGGSDDNPLSLPPPVPGTGDVKPGTAPSVFVPPENARPIDLSTALSLVAGRNPQVAFVQQRVAEALVRQEAAEALWLPSLRAGFSYNKHEGSIQEVGGRVFNVSRSSLYSGLGARAVGTGSPAVSGLSARFHLADAIFQPLIARRTAAARQHRVTAVTHDQLLQAALAHLDLIQAVERKRIALQTLGYLQQLADLTASFAKRGEGTQADADRALTERNLQKNVVTRAEEQIRIASARLTELLSLDEGGLLYPLERRIVPVELVPPANTVEALVTRALSQRPEMSENLLQVSAAVHRLKRERYSPLVPNVGLGVSYGGFGGGAGDDVRHYRDRFDLDAVLYWEIRNLGVGERTARKAARSRVHQMQFRRQQLANRIRREVTEAHAGVISARRQLQQANETVQSAENSLKRNFQRIRQGAGLPLEVLQSVRALDAARRERLEAQTAYNRAQFRLYRAIGWPVSSAAARKASHAS